MFDNISKDYDQSINYMLDDNSNQITLEPSFDIDSLFKTSDRFKLSSHPQKYTKGLTEAEELKEIEAENEDFEEGTDLENELEYLEEDECEMLLEELECRLKAALKSDIKENLESIRIQFNRILEIKHSLKSELNVNQMHKKANIKKWIRLDELCDKELLKLQSQMDMVSVCFFLKIFIFTNFFILFG